MWKLVPSEKLTLYAIHTASVTSSTLHYVGVGGVSQHEFIQLIVL